jgi:predicted metal-dependent hydrolase
MSDVVPRPRLAPELPLPPYAYVPGRFPHPISDPQGHQYGQKPAPVPAPDPRRWQDSTAYRYGLDLFNHGYYWEAHEQWEGLWHACGRRGPMASFLQGLIKLAAAGVKVREGKPAGVVSLARGAAEKLQRAGQEIPAGTLVLGLSWQVLLEHARRVEALGAALPPDTTTEAEPVFDFILNPQMG